MFQINHSRTIAAANNNTDSGVSFLFLNEKAYRLHPKSHICLLYTWWKTVCEKSSMSGFTVFINSRRKHLDDLLFPVRFWSQYASNGQFTIPSGHGSGSVNDSEMIATDAGRSHDKSSMSGHISCIECTSLTVTNNCLFKRSSNSGLQP